jgi:hypothetical protein
MYKYTRDVVLMHLIGRCVTDVSKLPDPSIARPRPSADAQKGQPEAQGHVTLEMDVMK